MLVLTSRLPLARAAAATAADMALAAACLFDGMTEVRCAGGLCALVVLAALPHECPDGEAPLGDAATERRSLLTGSAGGRTAGRHGGGELCFNCGDAARAPPVAAGLSNASGCGAGMRMA